MNKKELELIRVALLAVEKSEIKALKQLPTVDISHSEKFTKNMEKMLAGDWKPEHRSHARIPVAAAIAAAVLISLTITAVAFEEHISNFFESVFEKYTHLETNDTDTDILREIFVPEYIPAGYVETDYREGLARLQITWTSGEDVIMYSQLPLNKGSTAIDTENAEHSSVTVCGISMRRVIKSGTCLLIWEDGSYYYQLQCPAELDWEEIERFIGSIG